MLGFSKTAPLDAVRLMRTRARLGLPSNHPQESARAQQSVWKTLPSFPCREGSGLLALLRSPQRQVRTTPPSSIASSHRHAHMDVAATPDQRMITFIDMHGSKHTSWGSDGDSLLEIAQASPLKIEAACGGSCACSTCHVVVESEEMFAKMKMPTDDENDMLDLASGLTDTSRLSCQVNINKDLNGLVVSNDST